MVTRQKVTGRASSVPSGLAAGAAVSMAVTVIICSLAAWLITSEIIPQKQIGYCSLAALLLSAILGSMTAMSRMKRKQLIVSLMSGGIYYGLLMGVTILFFDGSFQGMGVTLVAVLVGSVIAVLISNRKIYAKPSQRVRKNRR